MTNRTTITGRDNPGALLIMALSMLLLSMGDVLVRLLGAVMPVGQLLGVRSVMLVVVLLCLMRWQRDAYRFQHIFDPWSLLRSASEVTAAYSFFTALQLLPIATATTIVFIYPLLLTLAAIPLFGEKPSFIRFIAVGFGFVGVVLVAGGSGDGVAFGFDSAMIFPLITAFCVAGRDLVTRKIDPSISANSVTLTASLAGVVVGFMSLAWDEWVMIGETQWLIFVVSTVVMTGSFITYIIAIRRGEMASIAPGQYLLIVWASIWGFVIWGEVPSLGGFAGAGLIVVAGLMVFWGDRGKKAPPTTPALPLE